MGETAAFYDSPEDRTTIDICAWSQALRLRTGQVDSSAPNWIPTWRPFASWSVFDRRKLITKPSGVNLRSVNSKAASSDRRHAPAKPTRSSARSRAPPSPRGLCSIILRLSDASRASFPCWAVPMAQRMPLSVSLTTKWRLEAGETVQPKAWWALVIAVSRKNRAQLQLVWLGVKIGNSRGRIERNWRSPIGRHGSWPARLRRAFSFWFWQ